MTVVFLVTDMAGNSPSLKGIRRWDLCPHRVYILVKNGRLYTTEKQDAFDGGPEKEEDLIDSHGGGVGQKGHFK